MQEVADEKCTRLFDKFLAVLGKPCEGNYSPIKPSVYTPPKICLFRCLYFSVYELQTPKKASKEMPLKSALSFKPKKPKTDINQAHINDYIYIYSRNSPAAIIIIRVNNKVKTIVPCTVFCISTELSRVNDKLISEVLHNCYLVEQWAA